MASPSILLTCEHGGNKIPPKFQNAFQDQLELLETHRGVDIGALGVAKLLKKLLSATLISSETSRLLVDLNRSQGNDSLFSEISDQFSSEDKELILKKYYFPHHVQVQNFITNQLMSKTKLLHIGIHSFTPVLNKKVRDADVGILFDPASQLESDFADELKNLLKTYAPTLNVRMNYPYKGTDDGLTTNLRKAYGMHRYAGIEIEMNQKFFETDMKQNQKVMANLFAVAIVQAKDKL